MNKQRKPPGRKAEVTGLKRHNLSLDDATMEKSGKIGHGNVSKGIRMAVSAMNFVECWDKPWALDTDAKVCWANTVIGTKRKWRLGDSCWLKPV